MKKINYLLLMLAVILGFGLTACNDDDNNNNNGSTPPSLPSPSATTTAPHSPQP